MKNIYLPTALCLGLLLSCPLWLGAQDTADREDHTTWAVTPPAYENNMIITAVLNIEGEESMDPNDKVAAFIGGTNNIRGVASPVFVPALNRYIVSLFVYSETGIADPITFQVYDASIDLVLPCITTETFAADKLVGSIADPDTIFTIRLEISFVKDDVLCDADTFGYAKANITGGTPPYSFLWSTGSTQDSVFNLGAGRYYLSVTDANNFTKVDSVDILNLNRPIQTPLLVAGPGTSVCEGTSVYVFAFSAEMESPSYQWYDIFNNPINIGQSLNLPNIAAPTQVFAETNVRNCLSPRSSISIAVAPAPNAAFNVNTNSANTQQTIIFTLAAFDPAATYFWQFGDGTTSTLPNPQHAYTAQGNYLVQLTVTTAAGCTAQSFQFIAVREREIDILFTLTRPECPTDASGAIFAQAINGAPPYTYLWSNGATINNLLGLLAGTYSVTVQDSEGNARSASVQLQAQQALLAPTLVINGGNGPICQGDDVWVNASSNVTDAEYYWYRDFAGTDLRFIGTSIVLFDIQASQTFWVETRRGGCRSALRTPVTINVTRPDARFETSVEVALVDQVIEFEALNPQFGFSYLWDFGDNTPNASGTFRIHRYDAPGVYEVHFTATAVNGCSATERLLLNILDVSQGGGGGLAASIIPQPADCAGDASGSASVQVLNGTPPFSYQWSNGASGSSVSGLLPGQYSVTVQDAGNNTATATAIVEARYAQIPIPQAIVNGNQGACAGDNIWLAASSTLPGAEYRWYDADDNLLFVGNPLFFDNFQGPYRLFLESRLGGCVSAERAEIIVPGEPVFPAFSASPAVVPEGGSIIFTPDTIVAGHRYLWDFGDGNFAEDTMGVNQYFFQGTYRVVLTVVTPDSCRASSDLFINVYGPSSGLALAFNLQHVACPDEATGSASSIVLGGVPPYSYQWADGSTTASVVGLSAGDYPLTVTDALGNTAEAVASILSAQPELLAPDVFVNAGLPVCQGGTAWAAASSNISGAGFYWYDAPVGGQLRFVGNPLLLSDLQGPQVFFVEARYGGCASSARTEAVISTQSADATFTASATVVEVGMAVNFTAAGGPAGQTYAWNFGDGTQAAGPLAAHSFDTPGLYEVRLAATLPNGCTAEERLLIRVVPEAPGLSVAFLVTPATCAEGGQPGAATAQASGGTPPYGYLWSNGGAGPSQQILGPGVYSVTVMDALGAMIVREVEVEAAVPAIGLPSVTVNGGQPLCLGGGGFAAAITGFAGAEYRWYDASAGGNLLFVGPSYPIIGLQANDTVYVEAFYQGCFSAGRRTVPLEPRGPDADFDIQGLPASVGLPVGFEPVAQDASYSYFWQFGDGGQSQQMLPQHVYQAEGQYLISLTVTDENGCTATSFSIIDVGTGQPLAVLLDPIGTQCYDDAAGAIQVEVFNGTPPYDYQWNNGMSGAFIQGLLPGTYSVTVTDSEGRSALSQAEVTSVVGQLLAPEAVVSGGNTVCTDEYLVIYAFDNLGNSSDFLWYNASQGGTLLAAGNLYSEFGLTNNRVYFVESVNGGCRSPRTEVQVFADNPNRGFVASANTLVAGGAVSFTPVLDEPSYEYQWFFGDGATSSQMSPVHTYANPGSYDVRLIVTSPGGCAREVLRQSYIQVVSATGLAALFDITHVDCEGQADGAISAVVLNGTPPFNYQWSTGATGVSISNLAPGSYSLTVTDAMGLNTVQSAAVAVLYSTPQAPFISANSAEPLCGGQAVVLTASSGQAASAYYWYNGAGALLGTGPSLVAEPQGSPFVIFAESQRGSCFSTRRMKEFAVEVLDAGFSVVGSLQPQAGQPVQFVPAQPGYAQYSWSFGDGAVATVFSPQHAYAAEGSYGVSLAVTSMSGCTASEFRPAYVQVQPEAVLSISAGIVNTLCAADEQGAIELAITGGMPPYEVAWSDGQSGPARTGLAAGNYAFTVTDSEGNTLESAAEVENLAIAIPPPTVLVNGGAPACKGELAFLLGSAPGYPLAAIYWFEDAGEPDEFFSGNLLVLPPMQQSVQLYAETVVNGCRSARVPTTVAMQAPPAGFAISPSADLEEGDLVQFSPTQPDPAFEYYWQFGDNGWSASPAPFYYYNLSGSFDVSLTVTDADGCRNTEMRESFVQVRPYAGFGPQELEERGLQQPVAGSDIAGISFPNPFAGAVTLVLKIEEQGWHRLALRDLYGRQTWVSNAYFRAGVEQLELNFAEASLPSGMYLLHVEGASGKKAIFKLVKN
jgi:PKD repeat protein